MFRRKLFLSAISALVLALILLVDVSGRSAAPADDAMTARLEAVAGAGMYGTHTFDYLTQLSDGTDKCSRGPLSTLVSVAGGSPFDFS